jgi:hypothetical protein
VTPARPLKRQVSLVAFGSLGRCLSALSFAATGFNLHNTVQSPCLFEAGGEA